MRQEILNKALELSELIEATANGVLEVSIGIEDTKASMAFIEAKIALDVAGEMDDKGKPVFSNEAMRSAEMLIRKRSDALIKEANELLSRSTVIKGKFQSELEKYRLQASLYKAFLNGGVE